MKKSYYIKPFLCIPFLLFLLLSCPEPDRFPDMDAESSYNGSGDNVFHIDTNGPVDLTHTLHLGSNTADIYYVFTNTSPYINLLHPEILSKEDTPEELEQESFRVYYNRTGPIGIAGKPEIAAFNEDVHTLLKKGTSLRDTAVLDLSLIHI